MELKPGLRGDARRVVGDGDTAVALGSGDVPVLGTPGVLALMEQAACAAIASALQSSETSVGTWVELEHLAPSKVGATVEATAELTAVNGKTLEFTCVASDGSNVVGRASHRRAIVDRERFLAQA